MAGLSVANVAETEHALSIPLSNVDAIYKANLDMKRLHQEVALRRVVRWANALYHESRYFAWNSE